MITGGGDRGNLLAAESASFGYPISDIRYLSGNAAAMKNQERVHLRDFGGSDQVGAGSLGPAIRDVIDFIPVGNCPMILT
jgi:hypothetical protein